MKMLDDPFGEAGRYTGPNAMGDWQAAGYATQEKLDKQNQDELASDMLDNPVNALDPVGLQNQLNKRVAAQQRRGQMINKQKTDFEASRGRNFEANFGPSRSSVSLNPNFDPITASKAVPQGLTLADPSQPWMGYVPIPQSPIAPTSVITRATGPYVPYKPTPEKPKEQPSFLASGLLLPRSVWA